MDSAALRRPQLCVVSESGVKLARNEERFSSSTRSGVLGDPIALLL